MLEALVFWALAVYGAWMLIYQSVGRLQRKSSAQAKPLTIILIVHNAEQHVEGVLRTLWLRTAFARRERRILVVDVGSDDDTGQIVQCMSGELKAVSYLRVADDLELMRQLHQLCLDSPLVGGIYDIRNTGYSQELARDVAWLCQ